MATIGSELSRQVARFKPEMLLLFDRSESNLYLINQELQDLYPHLSIVPIVGDILDRKHIEEVIRIYRPQLIYHAAAYKHVPLMEEQPFEAINNNVFGTEELALAARHGSVKKFVLISTDKAVKPVGIMGMTKRMAEGIIQSCNGGPTVFLAVRFGNVLGSDGSVLPLFQRQIAKGGPVTVTDPNASRYFMLVSEAAQLVL
jgi:FlaA1/EpsC-like NDP-sugar epimerase